MIRQLFTATAALSAFLFLSTGQSQAQAFFWTSSGSGSWTNSVNWNFGLSPDHPQAVSDTAYFSILSSGNKTVSLDAPINIKALNFLNGQTGTVTLTEGLGGSLTLTNTNAQPASLTVNASSGNHAISAEIALQGTTAHQWNIGGNRTFTVTGKISGALGLTKLGDGTLLLNGKNTFTGPATVSAGVLGGAGLITGAVTVATTGTITAGTAAVTPTLTLKNGLALNGHYSVTLFSNSELSKLVVEAGTVSLTNGKLDLVLGSGVTVSSFRAAGPRSFTIVDAANGQLSGTFSSTNFTTAGFAASEWSVIYDAPSGNATLNFTPVPEPAAVLGVCVIAIAAMCGFRRAVRLQGVRSSATTGLRIRGL